MKQNVGKADKFVRALFALLFAYLGYYYNPLWYVLAVLLVITVFTGFCWPYTWFGISTVKKAGKGKAKRRR